ncbi:hypothetical protein GCM10022289_07710 [Pedobacter jeongneungensis]|uniref:Tape measure protein N-terminal domain-containing protein n=1 Tax=Pedobacter jeongneungensis TaxID=947309 RepID=A0ABP8B6B2_9SPHI
MSDISFSITLKDLVSNKLSQVQENLQKFKSGADAIFSQLQNKIDKTNSLVVGFSFEGLVNKYENIKGKVEEVIGAQNAAFIAEKAWDGLKTIYNKGVELEQTQIRFESLTGSIGQAKKMLDQLSSYSGKSPYSGDVLTKSAEQMLSLGIAHDKIVPDIKMLGDVAMGNEEKFGTLSETFSNVMSAGKLMEGDLSKIIEQGFNPLKVISENTGISMDKLKSKMEDGAISADMIRESFKLATTSGGEYHSVIDELAQSAGGRWSTLMNTLSNVAGQIGLKLATWVSPIFEIGSVLLTWIIPFGSAILNVIKWVSDCTPLLIFLGSVVMALGGQFLIANGLAIAHAVVIGILDGAYGLATLAATAFNFVLSMNPISLIIIAIGALIAIIMVCWNKFAGFRGVIMGVWEAVKGFGMMIGEHIINRIKELISGMTGLAKALYLLFTGDFKKAWEVGKNAIVDLSGVKSISKLATDGMNVAKKVGKAYHDEVSKATKPKVVVATKTTNEKLEKMRPKQPTSDVFKSLLTDKAKKEPSKDQNITNVRNSSNSITGGGTQTSHITINLAKMQDQIVINTINSGEGATKMRQLLEEELNRLLGSITLMQTA